MDMFQSCRICFVNKLLMKCEWTTKCLRVTGYQAIWFGDEILIPFSLHDITENIMTIWTLCSPS